MGVFSRLLPISHTLFTRFSADEERLRWGSGDSNSSSPVPKGLSSSSACRKVADLVICPKHSIFLGLSEGMSAGDGKLMHGRNLRNRAAVRAFFARLLGRVVSKGSASEPGKHVMAVEGIAVRLGSTTNTSAAKNAQNVPSRTRGCMPRSSTSLWPTRGNCT